MYGLLHSANRRLAHLPAAASYSERFRRAFSSTEAATAGIDDLVYVGEGYRICGKAEIEDQIRRINGKATYQAERRSEIDSNGRKLLPPELHACNVAKLTCDSTAAGGICDVYVVGSDHNCPESWREVENVISFLKPEAVFLELCSRRLHVLTGERLKVPTMGEMFDMWKKDEDPFCILFEWFYAKSLNEHEGWESGESAGGEFRVAYEEAMKYGGKVILGDRPYHITERRILAKMSPWGYLFRPRAVAISVDLFKKAKDHMEYVNLVTEEVSKKFPALIEIYIRERDRYMSAKLLEVAREHNSVVAVVGNGHLAGIMKNWKQPVDMKEILNIPSGNDMGKMLNTFGAMVAFTSLSASQKSKIGDIITTVDSLKNT